MPSGNITLYDNDDKELDSHYYSTRTRRNEIIKGWKYDFPGKNYLHIEPEVNIEMVDKVGGNIKIFEKLRLDSHQVIADKPKEKIIRPPAEYQNEKWI